MASVARTDLSKTEHDELVCVYAALVLHDDGAEVSADSLQKVITASGNNVEKYWPALFAKSLKGQDLAGLLASVGSGSSSAAPVQAAVETKKTETKVEEPKKDDDEDALEGGIGFGDDEW